MSTNKPRIQAYIESSLYEQFEQERVTWGLSQSQTLERILSERYQSNIVREPASDRDLVPLISSINELRLRVSSLEDELESKLLSKFSSESDLSDSKLPVRKESLKDKWDRELGEKYLWEDGCFRIKQADGTVKVFCGSFGSVSKKHKTCRLFDSLTDSQFRIDIDRLVPPGELLDELQLVPSELAGSLPTELEGELPSESELSKGLTQRALSRRLGCSHPYIKNLLVLGELEDWSKHQDPQGLSWEFIGKKYYPKNLESKESAL